MEAQLIEKESIEGLKFAPAGELSASNLAEKLSNAAVLGNDFKGKAVIVFNTESGLKKVETTVWAVMEKFIQLKNGVHIPLNSLVSVDY